MKRLVLLAILLSIPALRALDRVFDNPRPPVAVGPRLVYSSMRIAEAEPGMPALPTTSVAVTGYPMATPQRAREEARRRVDGVVARWLDTLSIPKGWTPPPELIDSMLTPGPVVEQVKDYGTVYTQTLTLDQSPRQRARLLEAYERHVAGQRLAMLAGGLAFVLTCLATLFGYIRADEATKGYYTTHLRLASVGLVGAAGTALYYLLWT